MRLDVGEAIEQSQVGVFQRTVVLLGALVTIIDGFDLAAMGVVVPALAAAWNLPAGSFGPALAASFIGVAIGSALAGPLSDRFGRRPTLIWMTALVGVFTLATAFVENQNQLFATRFLTGLSAGATIPIVLALTAEYVPARYRSLLVVTMFAGAPLGGFLANVTGPMLLGNHSWHAVFVVGGVVPLVVSLLLALKLPESLRFLVVKGRKPDVARRLMLQVAPQLQSSHLTELVVSEPTRDRTAVGELFGDGRAYATLVLWTVFIATQFMVFLYTSWLPTLLKESGVALATALYITAVFQIGAVAGALVAGWASDRFRSDGVLALMFVAAVVGAAVLANTQSLPVMFLAAVMLGIGGPGAQVCLNAFAALLYPTHMRATGVGWALGIGRLGSIASPLLVGIALTAGWGPREIILGSLIPALTCLGGILLAAAKLKHQRPSKVGDTGLSH